MSESTEILAEWMVRVIRANWGKTVKVDSRIGCKNHRSFVQAILKVNDTYLCPHCVLERLDGSDWSSSGNWIPAARNDEYAPPEDPEVPEPSVPELPPQAVTNS